MMKTLKSIVKIILILLVGVCGILFAGYKIFLDKPGFFRQFEDENEARAYLLNDLTLNETDRDFTIEYMNQQLSSGERCGQLRDADIGNLSCPARGCPPVTDETPNSVMRCHVRAWDVLIEYRISLFFEYDTLKDITVEPRSNLP